MSVATERSALAGQWLTKADNDLTTAEHTLTLGEDCPNDTVCFHAQQCVEKSVKALLVACAVDVPRLHDLGVLIDLLPAGVEVPISAEEQELLTDYATVTRYPGDWDPIGADEARAAVAVARRVHAAAAAILGLAAGP